MTPEQITALRAKVFLDVTATNLAHALDNLGLTNYLNTVDPAYFVWRTSTPVADISDAVTWANWASSPTLRCRLSAPQRRPSAALVLIC